MGEEGLSKAEVMDIIERKIYADNTKYNLISFFIQFFRKKPVLNQDTAMQYLAELSRTRAEGSITTYGKFMKSILNYAGLPTERMVFNTTEHQPTYLEEPDLRKLCATPVRLRDILILRFMGFLGLRRGEVASLRVYDVDLENSEVLVRARASRKRDRVKSKKDRKVFIDSTTQDLLREYFETEVTEIEGYLFNITGRQIANIVKKYARESRVIPKGLDTDRYVEGRAPWEYVTPHTLRHSFAIMFLKKGGNIRTLQNILGHSSLEVTQMYLRWIPEVDKEEYMKVIG